MNGIIFPSWDVVYDVIAAIDAKRAGAVDCTNVGDPPHDTRPALRRTYAGSGISFVTHPVDRRVAVVITGLGARARLTAVQLRRPDLVEVELTPDWFEPPQLIVG